MLMAATVAKPAPRRDPAHRHTDGRKNRDRLQDQDPSMDYVLAFRGHADTGEQKYLAQGWKHCRQPADGAAGVRFKRGNGNVKPGEIMEESGHVLMCISKEARQEIVDYGDDSAIGQAGITEQDAVLSRLRDGSGMEESLRGLARRTDSKIFVQNETSAARPVSEGGV